MIKSYLCIDIDKTISQNRSMVLTEPVFKERNTMKRKIFMLTAMLLFGITTASFSTQSVQAAQTAASPTQQKDTNDTQDPEYWKYYSDSEQESDSQGISTYSADTKTRKSKYTGKKYTVKSGYTITDGVDVSKYQEDINWSKVKKDGIDYAIIRCGYRTYGSSGKLYSDAYFDQNMKQAVKAGVNVGVYIFSQATTKAEAVAEAEYCLNRSKSYLGQMDLPIVMDLEYASPNGKDGGRLYDAHLSKKEMTVVADAFCKRIEKAGYQAMVYANRSMLTDDMNAKNLTDKNYSIWLAHYTTNTSYSKTPYLYWQYSASGKVSGISGKADMNFGLLDGKTTPKLKLKQDESSVILTWNYIAGADQYRIQRNTDGTGWKTLCTLNGTAALTYQDNDLEPDRTYQYRICSIRNEKAGSYSNTVSGKGKLQSPHLKNAHAVALKSIQVDWKTVSGADGYQVYRKEKDAWKQLDTVADTSYTDDSAKYGSSYTYTVAAYKNTEDDPIVSQYGKETVTAKIELSAPEVTGYSVTYNTAKIRWKAVADAQSYQILRKNGDKWETIRTGITGTTYTDKGLTCGKSYTYKVKAQANIEGSLKKSAASKGITAKPIPATPSFQLTSPKKAQVKVAWNPVSGASGYEVYQKTSEGGKWTRVKSVSAKTTAYTVKAKSKKTAYYTVKAYRTVNGKKVFSNYKKNAYIKCK